MANKKITDLTAAAALDGSELLEGVQAGKSVKLTAGAIAELAAQSNRLIPAGGTTGQALAKVSGTDFDVGWRTISGGGGGVSSVSVGTVTAFSNLALNLTAEGSIDWFAWGATALYTGREGKKRAGIGIRKELYWSAGLGTGTASLTGWGFSAPPSFNALDAFYTPSAGVVDLGVFRSCNVGDSFFLVTDAGIDERVLRIYMSNAFPIDVYAWLTDGTSAQSLDVASPGSVNCYIPVTYQAATNGQKLVVEVRKASTSGNLGFSLATVGSAA
jgi:hypothetical protein